MSKELKANPMLKMLLPTAVKMLQNPALKTKLLLLANEQKTKYSVGEEEDVRILLLSVSDEIIAKVVAYDIVTNHVIDTLEVFTFDELVEKLTKLI